MLPQTLTYEKLDITGSPSTVWRLGEKPNVGQWIRQVKIEPVAANYGLLVGKNKDGTWEVWDPTCNEMSTMLWENKPGYLNYVEEGHPLF